MNGGGESLRFAGRASAGNVFKEDGHLQAVCLVRERQRAVINLISFFLTRLRAMFGCHAGARRLIATSSDYRLESLAGVSLCAVVGV